MISKISLYRKKRGVFKKVRGINFSYFSSLYPLQKVISETGTSRENRFEVVKVSWHIRNRPKKSLI